LALHCKVHHDLCGVVQEQERQSEVRNAPHLDEPSGFLNLDSDKL
jgi:hypothetical protein